MNNGRTRAVKPSTWSLTQWTGLNESDYRYKVQERGSEK